MNNRQVQRRNQCQLQCWDSIWSNLLANNETNVGSYVGNNNETLVRVDNSYLFFVSAVPSIVTAVVAGATVSLIVGAAVFGIGVIYVTSLFLCGYVVRFAVYSIVVAAIIGVGVRILFSLIVSTVYSGHWGRS